MKEIDVKISEIKHLLKEYYVEIESADGFVPVKEFVDKGMWEEWVLSDCKGDFVRVNQDHLFETDSGWKRICEMSSVDRVLKSDGKFHNIEIGRTGEMIPIVDVVINHPSHRYYANGFSSHNTNAGKSQFLCHHAAFCLKSNMNVLYITCEMAEERIAERIDANIMDIDINKLRDIPKDIYLKKFADKTANIKGRLYIKEYPTATANCNHIRALLQELRIKQKFVPDVVFVDYLSIMLSTRYRDESKANSYTIGKAVAEELRGLAIEYKLPIWTAMQFNRSGADNTDPTLGNIAESFGVAMTADLSFALVRSEKMDQDNVVMFKQLKNRYNDNAIYNKFLVQVDRPKMKFMDAPNNFVPNGSNGMATAGQSPTTSMFEDQSIVAAASKKSAAGKGNFDDFQY